MARESDRTSNFFFSPPALSCVVIYNWNIVDCDFMQPSYSTITLSYHIISYHQRVRQQITLTPPDTSFCPNLELAYALMTKHISPKRVTFPDFWVRYFYFTSEKKNVGADGVNVSHYHDLTVANVPCKDLLLQSLKCRPKKLWLFRVFFTAMLIFDMNGMYQNKNEWKRKMRSDQVVWQRTPNTWWIK